MLTAEHRPAVRRRRFQGGLMDELIEEVVHSRCTLVSLIDAASERDRTGAVCRDCWTVHAGECL